MKKCTKIWLIAAIALILVGSILFTGVMAALQWDFQKLSTREYETNTHAVTDSFRHISVITDTADINFVPSEDGTVSVVCHEDVNVKHRVEVKDDALTIEAVDRRKWYQYIGIGFDTPSITIYLPEGTYGDLTLRTSTGKVYISVYYTFDSMDVTVSTGEVTNHASVVGAARIATTTGRINVKSLEAGSLDLSVSTGDIQLKNITTGALNIRVTTGETTAYRVDCLRFTSDGTTGDLLLRDVVADDAFIITRSTGDVIFDDCDAATLSVTTDTGNVMGTLRTMKTFVTYTDTGSVTLPHRAPSGGECKLTTDTGNIYIALTEK